jgi:hypothetical protein
MLVAHYNTHAASPPVKRACFLELSAPASALRLPEAAPLAEAREGTGRLPATLAGTAAEAFVEAAPLCAVVLSRPGAMGAWLAWNNGRGADPVLSFPTGISKEELSSNGEER